jgi:hypothetical protein
MKNLITAVVLALPVIGGAGILALIFAVAVLGGAITASAVSSAHVAACTNHQC